MIQNLNEDTEESKSALEYIEQQIKEINPEITALDEILVKYKISHKNLSKNLKNKHKNYKNQ